MNGRILTDRVPIILKNRGCANALNQLPEPIVERPSNSLSIAMPVVGGRHGG
jgi:hypothetical protein